MIPDAGRAPHVGPAEARHAIYRPELAVERAQPSDGGDMSHVARRASSDHGSCESQPDSDCGCAAVRSQGPLNLLIDSTGIKAEGEGEWHARKHGGEKRRLWRKIHIGVDEQTLEIRAIEITGSSVGDAPMLPELLNQIPAEVEIGRSPRMVPTTPASATTPSPTEAPMPSYRPARTPSRGRRRPRVRSPGTRPSAHRDTSAAPSGENGPGITAEAAPRRRCTA